ncbi:phenylacetate--CoA ligase family protein [Paenibacillus pinihumi]|uniref:phenylacetate--CoA ligase family protein n=1 Tax=Paenibacillus pinihumi TaxID=669462 RepID=UPI0004202ACC|nr:phenylacetate--CoA ligase family protein [Paenibacillus pinihumi]
MWNSSVDKILQVYNHAKEHTDFYKNHFSQNEEILTNDDFEKIPLLTKKDIRDNYTRLLTEGVTEENCIPYWTSGSTGIPVKYLRSKEEFFFNTMSLCRERKRISEKAFKGPICHFDKIKEPLKFIYNGHEKKELILSLYENNDERYKLFVSAINEFKPTILQGYASSLFEFAKYININKINMTKIQLVENRSEHLTDGQRSEIAEAFGGTVTNMYGLAELFPIAYECKYKKMHICSDNVFLEVLSESNESDFGEIVVTSLNCKTLPLIRYRTGDIGKIDKQECTCGRLEPVLTLAQGRLSDYIITPNGRMNPVLLRRLFRYLYEDENSPIIQLQFIQVTIYDFIVKAISKGGATTETENKIRELVLSSFPYTVSVTVEWVETLEFHPITRKVSSFISLIDGGVKG